MKGIPEIEGRSIYIQFNKPANKTPIMKKDQLQ